jgi:hypothetical protein
MLALVVSALGARRTQAIALFLLTVLATAGAAFAPVYQQGLVERIAEAQVESAPVPERTVSIAKPADLSRTPRQQIDSTVDAIDQAFPLPYFEKSVEVRVSGQLRPGKSDAASFELANREGMCAHVSLRGHCPRAPGEFIVRADTAVKLGLAVGDSVLFKTGDADDPQMITMVGTYQPIDAAERFWGYRAVGAASSSDTDMTGFTALPTLFDLHTTFGVVQRDRLVTAAALNRTDFQQLALDLEVAQARSRSKDDGLTTGFRPLANRLTDEQNIVAVGVPVAAAQLLLLCWFALFFAIRQAAPARRGDAGLLKLRGARRRDMWKLTAMQSGIPGMLGALFGGAAGFYGGLRLSGGIADSRSLQRAELLAVAAAAAAVLGALAAVAVAERGVLREPVNDLLRQVPPRRRRWITDALDLVVVLLAAVGVYEVTVDNTGGAFSVLAPMLLALAVGLLAARLVMAAATRLGRSALRSARIGVALSANHLARRSSFARVFALLVVAVALLCAQSVVFDQANRARIDRAEAEVGADTVLTVTAASRAALLAGVRRAEPTGRYAMAAVESHPIGLVYPTIALDSTRLAAVVPWHREYGAQSANQLAALLRPAAPEPRMVSGATLTVDASIAGPTPMVASARLIDPKGIALVAALGTVTAGRHRLTGAMPACSGTGCRLVALDFRVVAQNEVLDPATLITIHSLDGVPLGDLTAWRTSIGREPLYSLSSTGGALVMAADVAGPVAPQQMSLFPVDGPTSLPIVTAGGSGLSDETAGQTQATPFGQLPYPVTVVGKAAALPRLLTHGAIIDLDYADRLVTEPDQLSRAEVWLAPGAPADIEQRLAAQGLPVVGRETVAARVDRLADQGRAGVQRYTLIAAMVALLLGLGAVIVMAAAERDDRARELAALRVQGVPARTIRWVARFGYGALVVVGLAAGMATAYVIESVTTSRQPLFSDSWSVLAAPPTRPAVQWESLAAAAVLALLTVWVLAGQLARRARPAGERREGAPS